MSIYYTVYGFYSACQRVILSLWSTVFATLLIGLGVSNSVSQLLVCRVARNGNCFDSVKDFIVQRVFVSFGIDTYTNVRWGPNIYKNTHYIIKCVIIGCASYTWVYAKTLHGVILFFVWFYFHNSCTWKKSYLSNAQFVSFIFYKLPKSLVSSSVWLSEVKWFKTMYDLKATVVDPH